MLGLVYAKFRDEIPIIIRMQVKNSKKIRIVKRLVCEKFDTR